MSGALPAPTTENVHTILPLAPMASLLGKNLGLPTCLRTLAFGFWNFHW